MRDIRQYLHLYLGCRVDYNGIKGLLTKVDIGHRLCQVDISNMMGQNFSVRMDEVKPILRPLSSMTEEEKEESEKVYVDMQDKADAEGHICDAEIWAEHSRWLLSKHFDVFQLIEYGLAIEKQP